MLVLFLLYLLRAKLIISNFKFLFSRILYLSGVDFINCCRPFAKLSRLSPNFCTSKKLLKSWVQGAIVGPGVHEINPRFPCFLFHSSNIFGLFQESLLLFLFLSPLTTSHGKKEQWKQPGRGNNKRELRKCLVQ